MIRKLFVFFLFIHEFIHIKGFMRAIKMSTINKLIQNINEDM